MSEVDGKKLRTPIPDWIKLGISTVVIVLSMTWHLAEQQTLQDKRLDALEKESAEVEQEHAVIMNQLTDVNSSLVLIETTLHYGDGKGTRDFPLPQLPLK